MDQSELDQILAAFKTTIISENTVPRHLRGFTNWGINSSKVPTPSRKELKPLLTPEGFKSTILDDLTQHSNVKNHANIKTFLPDKKLADFRDGLLCCMDNVLLKILSNNNQIQSHVAYVCSEAIQYINVKSNTVFIGHTHVNQHTKISILQQKDGDIKFTRIARIKMPAACDIGMCISYPVMLFWAPDSTSFSVWNFFSTPNASWDQLEVLDVLENLVDIVGVVDIAFQLLLIITKTSVLLCDLFDKSDAEIIYQSDDAADGGQIVLYKYCAKLDCIILLTDDGLLFALDIAKRNRIQWQIGLPLKPIIDELSPKYNKITTHKLDTGWVSIRPSINVNFDTKRCFLIGKVRNL